jgi:hypothetical protein
MRRKRVDEVLTLNGATGVWAVRISSGFHVDKILLYLSLWLGPKIGSRLGSGQLDREWRLRCC